MGERKQGRYQWYRTAAVHLWRTYFRYQLDGRQPDTEQKKKTFFLCESAFSEMADYEQKFLPLYYTSKWNEDEQFVENYAARTGISTTTLWRTVYDSNRRLFELAGMLEPKE